MWTSYVQDCVASFGEGAKTESLETSKVGPYLPI